MILFHILDEAEVTFPYDGMIEFEDPRRKRRSSSMPAATAATIRTRSPPSAAMYKQECFQTGIDYVPLDTSMQFDKALLEYLLSRRARC